jgi:feruloyl esterase
LPATPENDRLAPVINAMNPDISEFAAAGGKLIQYHGLSDPVVPPRDSIDYFERVQAFEAKSKPAGADESADHYRLFLVPGMQHCQGGEGANVLDVQRALEAWVEDGKAPDQVTATKYLNDKREDGVAFSRPLCPYPQRAQFNGTGSPSDAASFSCKPGRRYPAPLIAPAYMR